MAPGYNAEANMRIWLTIKADIKKICKNTKQCHSTHKIVFENSYFS